MKYLSTLLLLLMITGIITSIATIQVASADNHEESDEDNEDTDTPDTEKTEETDESDESDETEEIETAYEREVEVEESDKEWKIKSEVKNGENKDKFEAEFKLDDEPEIKFKYSTESSSNDSEMKYRINFDDIIEFANTGNTSFNPDEDTIISTYHLDEVEWNAIEYNTETIDGNSVYTATVSTTDGVFTLVLKLSTGITSINETIITPNAIKIDVIIQNYQYEGENTYLSLNTGIKTEFETEIETESVDEQNGFADQEAQVGVTNNDIKAFFSWAEYAEADGVTVDVISSSLGDAEEIAADLEEGESHQQIFFTFDKTNPQKIVWDPKVGVVSQSVQDLINSIRNSGNLPLSFPFLPFAVLLVLPLWQRRRK